MDPNQTLKEIREALQEAEDACCFEHANASLREAAGKFEALDGWLSTGGFKPKEWL